MQDLLPEEPIPATVERPDQVGMGLCDELQDACGAVKLNFAEGRVEEAYQALREVLACGAELMNGFQLISHSVAPKLMHPLPNGTMPGD